MASSLLPGLHRPPAKSTFPFPSNSPRRSPTIIPSTRTPVSASVSSSSSSSWEREEQRWLREEQRWLREEQRWLREESRWSAERESLLLEISSLRLRIEALERDRSGLQAVIVAAPASEGSAVAVPPRPVLLEEAQVKEMILEEARVSESAVEKKEVVVVEEKKKKQQEQIGRQTLRTGSEGEDVRVMQEALQRLGFYSGEEDMEFSYFSSGTERAVKTWQASLGAPEDGIMTAELLERLFVEKKPGDTSSKDSVNGAVVTSIAERTEIQQKIVRENGDTKVDVSQHRVFLLGENRWEEPSRLIGRDKPVDQSKPTPLPKCLSCRGEGRLMCTECDGTGEPNIEPQFLEWVDEGAKCPYCEGLGYTVCDVCEGKTTVEV